MIKVSERKRFIGAFSDFAMAYWILHSCQLSYSNQHCCRKTILAHFSNHNPHVKFQSVKKMFTLYRRTQQRLLSGNFIIKNLTTHAQLLLLLFLDGIIEIGHWAIGAENSGREI